MEKRELNNAFNEMMKNNEDIDKKTAREYFDVIGRHAPSLAKDPLVAPQIIRQFDTFGGVDVNTVRTLREIENKFGPQSEPISPNNVLAGMSSIHSMSRQKK